MSGETTGTITFGTGITFPVEHPAIRDPEKHRPAFDGIYVDGNDLTITVKRYGYIDGPFTVGEGWTLKGEE